MTRLDEIKESVAEGYGYYDHAARWRKRNLPHEVKTHLAWLVAEVERQAALLDAERIAEIVFQHSDDSERQGPGDSCCACYDIHVAKYPAHIAELIRGGD